MTAAQHRVILTLATREKEIRAYACQTKLKELQVYHKETADECLRAISILRDVYEEEEERFGILRDVYEKEE